MKLFKSWSNAAKQISVLFRHSAGLLDAVIRRTLDTPGEYLRTTDRDILWCAANILQQIWSMVDGSLDNLLAIIKAPEPLSTTLADYPSASRLCLVARVRVVDKDAGKPFPVSRETTGVLDEHGIDPWVWEQDDTVVMDLKPKTLLQYFDLCLRRDEESSLEKELIPTWTEQWTQAQVKNPHWPYHKKPLTLFDERFVEAVILMLSKSCLDPKSDYAYDCDEVASFVHGVFHSVVEFDLGQGATA